MTTILDTSKLNCQIHLFVIRELPLFDLRDRKHVYQFQFFALITSHCGAASLYAYPLPARSIATLARERLLFCEDLHVQASAWTDVSV